ncbi:MAG: TlyA family rRNA (cytidine-2'-O)-methyltransferase [Planctomycetes bacterium]|nr:TlyA family rRNA (cytidine-2'-O)-methyltransferase [Planctomycetota bacterium]
MASEQPFVSRAGLKLEHALETFQFDVTNFTCVDLGCNVGGFTDCLLQRGASKVYAVDTGYGTLAWKLRSDDRVITMERTNALHVEPKEIVDLAVVDLGWTRQTLAIPAAIKWTKSGQIITLVKPHYELTKEEKTQESVSSGLSEEMVERVLKRVRAEIESMGLCVIAETKSPIRGKKSSKKGSGNAEHLMLLRCEK